METNPILAELTDSDLSKLAALGEMRVLSKGDAIVREGVETPDLFLVLEGSLSVTVGSPPTHLATLYPGEIVGEMSFVDSRASSAIVKAEEASHVLAISRSRLEQLLSEDTAMGARFFRGIARLVVRRLRTTIRHLSYGEAPKPRVEVQVDRRLLEKLSQRAPAGV